MLFEKISGIGENIFYTTQNKGVYMFDHYRPIGTPWDFAPDTARVIDINSEGVCSFQETEEDGSYIVDKWLQLPYLILWRECPEHLKGRILPRPEWAGGNN